MLKAIGSVAAVGFVGVVLFKVLGMLLLPLVGMFVGLVFFIVKITVITALMWWGYHLFKKWTERGSEA